MLSAMLCRGRLSDFVPIGQDGAPVYQHADAFRDAVSRIPGRGAALSRFLAKPKFSPDYKQVEWFVSFAPASPERGYRVIPWKNARAEEREQALKELQSFAFELEGFADELLQLSGDGNARLFAHYLTGQGGRSRLPAVHFPGPDYIYIVDGQPVVTFWGFLAQGSRTGLDPFSCLRHPRAAAAATAAGAAATSAQAAEEGGEGSVSPSAAADGSENTAVPPPEASAAWPDPPADKGVEKEDDIPEPAAPLPPQQPAAPAADWSAPPGGSFSRHINEERTSTVNSNSTAAADWSSPPPAAAAPAAGGSQLGKWLKILLLLLLLLLLLWLAWRLLSGWGGSSGSSTTEPVRQETVLPPEEQSPPQNNLAAEPEKVNTAVPAVAENLVPAETKEAVVEPAAAVDPEVATVDPIATAFNEPWYKGEAPAALPEQAEVLPEEPVPVNNVLLTSEETQALSRQNMPLPDPAAAEQAQSQNAGGELRLPDSNSTAAGGNLSFLEGNWKAVSGMMDTSTGKPLNLSYNYKQGSGELVVERQDKSKCTVRANPSYSGGTLTIEAAGRAVCPDNSSYTLPRIICQPSADGKADCQAYYSADNHFPIKIQGN